MTPNDISGLERVTLVTQLCSCKAVKINMSDISTYVTLGLYANCEFLNL
jgi:hypothetical protein